MSFIVTKKPKKQIVVSALILFALLWLFAWYRPFEPHYHGRPLSYWANDVWVNDVDGSCDTPTIQAKRKRGLEAIRIIGDKALPLAIELCQAKDSKLKSKLASWSEDLSESLHIDLRLGSDFEKHNQARAIFYALGAAAKPAIPSLLKILQENRPMGWDTAMEALHFIGSDSVPPLIKLLTDENGKPANEFMQGRYNATRCLGMYFYRQASNAVPTLVHFLSAPDPWLRGVAAEFLPEISNDPVTVMPALVKYLETETNEHSLSLAVPALVYFGSNGLPAVPVLTKFAISQQYGALVTLRKIDLAAAESIFERLRASQSNTAATNPPGSP